MAPDPYKIDPAAIEAQEQQPYHPTRGYAMGGADVRTSVRVPRAAAEATTRAARKAFVSRLVAQGRRVLLDLLARSRAAPPGGTPRVRRLAAGVYGVTYQVTGASAARLLEWLAAGKGRKAGVTYNEVFNGDLSPGAPRRVALLRRLRPSFVVKVDNLSDQARRAKALVMPDGSKVRALTAQARARTENLNHLRFNQHEMRARDFGVPEAAANWSRVTGYRFSPVFGAGFSVDGPGDGAGPDAASFRLTVMEYVDGPTLDALDAAARRGPRDGRQLQLPPEVYVEMEMALLMLWHAGLLHNDLHIGNVMLTGGSRNVRIIDFGLGACIDVDGACPLLPPGSDFAANARRAVARVHERIAQYYGSDDPRFVDALYGADNEPARGGMRGMTRRLAANRGQDFFNPDTLSLPVLRALLPAVDSAAAVGALRRRVLDSLAPSPAQRASAPRAAPPPPVPAPHAQAKAPVAPVSTRAPRTRRALSARRTRRALSARRTRRALSEPPAPVVWAPPARPYAPSPMRGSPTLVDQLLAWLRDTFSSPR
jgi:ABC1 atypical kinase-like domain